jgi:hypothetical protein
MDFFHEVPACVRGVHKRLRVNSSKGSEKSWIGTPVHHVCWGTPASFTTIRCRHGNQINKHAVFECSSVAVREKPFCLRRRTTHVVTAHVQPRQRNASNNVLVCHSEIITRAVINAVWNDSWPDIVLIECFLVAAAAGNFLRERSED